jgi:hypothetical protein
MIKKIDKISGKMPKGKYITISIIVAFILTSFFANISLPFWYRHREYKAFAAPIVFGSFPIFCFLVYYTLKTSYKRKTRPHNEGIDNLQQPEN